MIIILKLSQFHSHHPHRFTTTTSSLLHTCSVGMKLCYNSIQQLVLIRIALFPQFRSSSTLILYHTFCCCSISQSCKALCTPMDCSMPSVPHHLPKFAQVHVHCISDAIQPSHSLMPSSPSALYFSQHQGLFQ